LARRLTDKVLIRWAILSSRINARAFDLTLRERQDVTSSKKLTSGLGVQHLHKHFNDVSGGILRPVVAVHACHLPSDFGENANFELKLCNHKKSIVITENRLFSPVATVLRIFRWSCPSSSFPLTTMRMITSCPSRASVRQARELPFFSINVRQW
jgi:hypothetical protein